MSARDETPVICIRDGCGGSHRHPITGKPPDYHFEKYVMDKHTGCLEPRLEPRWNRPARPSGKREEWLLSPAEVAVEIGVTTATVRRWCREKRISATPTPGGHYRVRLGDVLGFLEGQTRHAPGGKP